LGAPFFPKCLPFLWKQEKKHGMTSCIPNFAIISTRCWGQGMFFFRAAAQWRIKMQLVRDAAEAKRNGEAADGATDDLLWLDKLSRVNL